MWELCRGFEVLKIGKGADGGFHLEGVAGCAFDGISQDAVAGGDEFIPLFDFAEEVREAAAFPAATLIADAFEHAEFLGIVEEADDAQVGLEEVVYAAEGGVAGVLGFAEGVPGPGWEAGAGATAGGPDGARMRAESEVGLFAALGGVNGEGDDAIAVERRLDATAVRPELEAAHRLNLEPVVGIVFVGGLAVRADEFDDGADAAEGQGGGTGAEGGEGPANRGERAGTGVEGVVDGQSHERLLGSEG